MVLTPGVGQLNDQYLIVNHVAELDQGTYVLHPGRGLEALATGNMREAAARLACGRRSAADVHVNACYLARLHPILQHYGDRGYRIAHLEAAIDAGKLRLAAHSGARERWPRPQSTMR